MVTDVCRDHPQCVVLGAGYDTRADRLPALADRHVFEVDHPATQTAKRAVIDRLGLEHTHIAYVAVDFERDDLATELDAAGFDRSSPTLFIWEGVTQYLTREAVEATLTVIRGLAVSGTFVIVTYVDARALDDPSPFPEAHRWGPNRRPSRRTLDVRTTARRRRDVLRTPRLRTAGRHLHARSQPEAVRGNATSAHARISALPNR